MTNMNSYLSGFCCVCHLFLPLVSIFGLFPVLVSCHYELSMFQLCLSRYVLITLCILVLSFEFDPWEFGGIAASAASPLAASPNARRSREISAAGGGYPKPAGWLPGSRVAAPPARCLREITPPDRH